MSTKHIGHHIHGAQHAGTSERSQPVTNPATGAALQAAAIDLFLQPSFTLDLIWRQDSSDDPGPVARFGNLVLHRHADGMVAIHNMARLQDLAQAITRLLKT